MVIIGMSSSDKTIRISEFAVALNLRGELRPLSEATELV
jgi:hypothetical protein